MVLLHCVEDHSSRIDAHGKGGVSTSIVTKMSYCVFTKTETKGAKEDNGAIVRLRARVCSSASDARVPVQRYIHGSLRVRLCGQNQTSGGEMERDYLRLKI